MPLMQQEERMGSADVSSGYTNTKRQLRVSDQVALLVFSPFTKVKL